MKQRWNRGLLKSASGERKFARHTRRGEEESGGDDFSSVGAG